MNLPVHHTAGVLIECNDRFVLVVKKFNNRLDIPCGHIEFNEDTRTAAIRETKEETFIDLRPERIVELGEWEHIEEDSDSGVPFADGRHIHKSHIFFCRMKSLPPMIASGDSKDIKILTLDELERFSKKMLDSAIGAFELLKRRGFKAMLA